MLEELLYTAEKDRIEVRDAGKEGARHLDANTCLSPVSSLCIVSDIRALVCHRNMV